MIRRKIAAAIMSMALTAGAFAVPAVAADAASFNDINSSSVFVKQQESDTCTLASNVMMLRRTALMRGDSDWKNITEGSCRSTLWYADVGMYHSYSYKNINVNYGYISGSPRSQLIELLKQHPEGIVAYDYDYPHAILLTDYTNGTFYCSDPARNTASGRMSVSGALISIDGVDSYWYVTSPDVKLGSDSTIKPDYKVTTVNEKWTVTADTGVNMRSEPTTASSIVGGVGYNVTVTVTKKTTNDGYTWGYTSNNGKNGWIALDYAKKATAVLKNNSTVSSTYISLGQTVTLKAASSGGTGSNQYAFYYRKKGANTWSAIRDYSTNASASFKPSKSGYYDLMIKVKDSSRSIAKKYFDLTVDAKLYNNSSVSAEYTTVNTPVTMTANSSGGLGNVQYAYYYKRSTASTWSTVKAYSTSTSVQFKPTAVCSYDLMIKVKDEGGTVEKKYFTLNSYHTFYNRSRVSSEKIYTGEYVKLYGVGAGGSENYTYAYYYKKPGESEWVCVSDFCKTSIIKLTPDEVGDYEICIKVKDDTGTVLEKYFTVSCAKALYNQSVLSANTVQSGSYLSLKAFAVGGSEEYTYAYYNRKSGTEKWTVLKDFSSTKCLGIRAGEAGKYEVCIKVKDSDGNIEKKYLTYTVTE